MDRNKEPEKTMGILKSISVLLSGAFAFILVAGILGLILTFSYDSVVYFTTSYSDYLFIIISSIFALIILASVIYFAGTIITITLFCLIPIFLIFYISTIPVLEKILYVLVIGIIVISALLYRILDKINE